MRSAIIQLVSFVSFALPASAAFSLSATSLTVGPTAGANSVFLLGSGAWTATANASWIHLNAGSTSGANSQLVSFTYDANSGSTQTGTITFNNGAITFTITQAGAAYVPVAATVALPGRFYGTFAIDGNGNIYSREVSPPTLNKWDATTQQTAALSAPGLFNPQRMLADSAGNLYIATMDDVNQKAVPPKMDRRHTAGDESHLFGLDLGLGYGHGPVGQSVYSR
jgi:hypothetical protein